MFGGRSEADCPTAQFFAECAQVGGGVDLGDQEVDGVPAKILQPGFSRSAQKFDQINDSIAWTGCNCLLEGCLKSQIGQ
ncbi:hypothetical protein [Verminephrobacter eiseniae]|uniref:hypothetical protein n=1 Tax=Verminephrobacter eiseniae TaxID=364317 RepID=UPI0022445C69|nr:hypothetical protein [Verminephrobacter eiseniae]